MEDVPNVNRLNGVPNFGHGFPTEFAEETAPEAEDISEQVDITNEEQE